MINDLGDVYKLKLWTEMQKNNSRIGFPNLGPTGILGKIIHSFLWGPSCELQDAKQYVKLLPRGFQ